MPIRIKSYWCMRFFNWSVLGLLISALFACQASGTYPPSGAPRVIVTGDRGTLELGRAIFAGKAKLSGVDANGDTQRPRLSALQSKLPPSVRRSVDLPSMAGHLTAEQMSALESFLEARFEIKL